MNIRERRVHVNDPYAALDSDDRLRALEALYYLVRTISTHLDFEKMTARALKEIISFMKTDAGIIYWINNNGELIPVAYTNISERTCSDLLAKPVRVGECLCGSIAETGEEIVIDKHASCDQRVSRESVRHEGMEFYAGLPLLSGDRLVGILCAITHEPYDLDRIGLPVLRQLTSPLGIAMENAKLTSEIKKDRERLKIENQRLRHIVDSGAAVDNMLGSSPAMTAVFKLIHQVADAPTPILITGESGTGKELVAQALHHLSGRKDKPFIAINCGALTTSVVESELFGHEKGAFTGAENRRKGYLELANGGSLFLDEVHLLPQDTQAKLLRAIQEKIVFRLGSEKSVRTDFRVITASNIPLDHAVEEGSFRKDLYYRLNVIQIHLPPLRERIEDIPALACHFAKRFAKTLNKPVDRISPEAMNILQRYSWPGNVRELQNAVERAVVVSSNGAITQQDLDFSIRLREKQPKTDDSFNLASVERAHIENVLNIVGGQKHKAAQLLGIHPTTLWRKLCKLQHN